MDEKQQDALWAGLTKLPREIQERMGELIEQGLSKEEFLSALMVGPCPDCGSEKTRDDDDVQALGVDPGDTTVGVCLDCGYLWCLECGDGLISWPCSHWDICASCADCPTEEEMEQGALCPFGGQESVCPKIIHK